MTETKLCTIFGKVCTSVQLLDQALMLLVYDTQSRTTHSVSDTRCRNLFWRVWGNSHLSLTLNQATMTSLYMQLQQPFNLNPFNLSIEQAQDTFIDTTCSDEALNEPVQTSIIQGSSSESGSLSPLHEASGDPSSRNEVSRTQNIPGRRSKEKGVLRNTESRPALSRQLSSDGRKRSGTSIGLTRGRTRPTMLRKRSSQTSQGNSDKPARSILKSPRSSQEEYLAPEASQQVVTAAQPDAERNADADEPSSRRISTFELPSASSWQSIESHDRPARGAAETPAEAQSMLVIDKNFRKRFSESQRVLRPSTSLASANKLMKKTGSVVRFADEVNVAEQFRRNVAADQGQGQGSTPQTPARAASDGQVPDLRSLERQDSTGSVAAVSEDGEDDEQAIVHNALPRVASQLSLALAKQRSGSSEEHNLVAHSSHATVPAKIERDLEGQDLGKMIKPKDEVEEKLLAIGRRDGVTKAGGVNLPKELTIDSARSPVRPFDLPEKITF